MQQHFTQITILKPAFEQLCKHICLAKLISFYCFAPFGTAPFKTQLVHSVLQPTPTVWCEFENVQNWRWVWILFSLKIECEYTNIRWIYNTVLGVNLKIVSHKNFLQYFYGQ